MSTSIEWCKNPDGSMGSTWNPVTGCRPDYPCWDHCYARRMANRLAGRYGYDKDDPFKVTFHPDKLDELLRWKKPRTIFVCSMGDLFAHGVKRQWQNAVFNIMLAETPHTFILLTKRVKEVGEYLSQLYMPDFGESLVIGTSVSTQAEWDERVPLLCQIPAQRRVVSVEPMLGPIHIWPWTNLDGTQSLKEIHGILCGGESGPGARPMHPDWVRSLRDQCKEAGVAFHFKSWGEWAPFDDWRDKLTERQLYENNPVVRWVRLDGQDTLCGPNEGLPMIRVGKKRSGRLLDGREHNELYWTKETSDEV